MDWGCRACGGTNPAGTRFCGHCGTAADEPEAADERRLITALFADISGFTTLADSLDAEELHAVISPVIGVLAGIAERYGGTLAKYAGDAVLVFFGAPVAQEDHASRALLCAQAMHAELADALPRLPQEAQGLELHIGVNSGTVIAGMFGGDIRTDYSILGDAVNVAQRLESVAPPGETYVGELTYELTSDEFDLEPLGELSLKGKTKGVPGWRLRGRRQVVVTPQSANRFVGRRHEMGVLLSALDDVDASGGVVVVTAEAGAGKSRLTQEVHKAAADRGMLWLEARAISYGASLPYWPLVDLLRRSFGIRIDQDPSISSQALAASLAVDGVPDIAPYFSRVLGLPPPPGHRDIADMEPEAYQRALHDAVATWVRHLAAVRPVVLAAEDLHWLDSSSTELLRHLARTVVADSPVLLLLTGRPEAVDAAVAIAGPVDERRRSAVSLGPLDEAAFDDLLADAFGAPPAPELRRTVFERTAGNPFFAQQLAKALLTGDALTVVDGRWQLRPDSDESAVPPTIEGVLTARMDQLPRTAASLLQVASVIGRSVNVALLEGAAEDVTDVPHVLGQLVSAGFLDRAVVDGTETLVFHHALMVDVAYARLMRRQRRDLHRRVAETAEVLYGTGPDVIDLLARHFYLAEAGVKAVDYLERAADRSARLFANEEAILHLERAVELTRATERLTSRLPTLLVDLADLEDLVGRFDNAVALYTEARDRQSTIRAWRGVAAILRKKSEFGSARQVVDEAFADRSLAGEDLTSLWLERTWTLVAEGRFLEAIETAQAGLAANPDPHSREGGMLLLQLARAETALSRCDEAQTHCEPALRILEAHGDLRGVTVATRILGDIHADRGDAAEAAVVYRRALDLATRTGNAEEVASCILNLGMVVFDQGDVEGAIALDREAVARMEEMEHKVGLVIAEANLSEKLAVNGEVDEALRRCVHAMELATKSGDRWTLADCHRTMAMIYEKQGLPAESAAQAEQAAHLFADLGDRVNARRALEQAAHAAEAFRDEEWARRLTERAHSL